MVCIPNSDWDKQTFDALLVQVMEVIGAQKQAIDALVVMPITRVIRAGILEFEQSPPKAQSTATVKRWRGHLGALLGDQLPAATFHEETVRDMLGV
ncbi:hypothetical protein [Mesorhizobium temperatum]|uniref:Uncharacterized protein n=1 Tax=Mesorhizobium temperatum TaxID=241416 RepID=A0A271LH03_9HYPH|nr:hypothetical protein [Mesorhizobium temperatum]PAQ06590.1 hypothetical protein CIT26_26070 [Mesorhizobium temperatum]